MAVKSKKYDDLIAVLKRRSCLGVAFSGGVDSTLLLEAAKRAVGGKVVAFTAQSPIHAPGDVAAAQALALDMGVDWVLIETDECQQAGFVINGADRCYVCKKGLFAKMAAAAAALEITALAHGANTDDAADYRPGMRAASEMGVAAPLVEAGLTKADVRRLARRLGLPVWNKPAKACLATRIPYGHVITPQDLALVNQAEERLLQAGFTACRVRLADRTAHIEVHGDQIKKMLSPRVRSRLLDDLRGLGFLRICLDLEGYVSGKMNRWLSVAPSGQKR
jgi:uncharacterized protein